jgi:Ni,Fe-hydrogenase I large subunit
MQPLMEGHIRVECRVDTKRVAEAVLAMTT